MTWPQATRDTLIQRNHELYDHTSDEIWRLVAYDPLHEGWEFINLGGRWLLDRIAQRARLSARSTVLDLCCGQGAGCRYLAQQTGCAAIGVDLNEAQVRTARQRLSQENSLSNMRVRYVHADALTWRDQDSHDAVICLDALMLVPDTGELVRAAREGLKPGGLIGLSTIGAGPSLDERLRYFAWQVDAMASLPSVQELGGLLPAEGFSRIECEDITPLAIAASETMQKALDHAREAIVARHGELAWVGWQHTNGVYLRAFAAGTLRYLFVTAVR
jgi:cyclopropane fatty-acyl-phospholipid synthase-like methyltransferase